MLGFRRTNRTVLMLSMTVFAAGCGLLPGRKCRPCAPVRTCESEAMHVVSEADAVIIEDVRPDDYGPHVAPDVHFEPAPTAPPPRQKRSAEPPPPGLRVPPKPQAATTTAPGALTIDVTANRTVAAAGQDVTFELIVENQGKSPIGRVELTATVGSNLKVKSVKPAGSAKVVDNQVAFEPILNFMPMPMKFQVTAGILRADGGTARISIEVKSPILKEGPLKKDMVVRISDS